MLPVFALPTASNQARIPPNRFRHLAKLNECPPTPVTHTHSLTKPNAMNRACV